MSDKNNNRYNSWHRYRAAQEKLGLWPLVYFIGMIVLYVVLYFLVSPLVGNIFLGVTATVGVVVEIVVTRHYEKDDALVQEYLNRGPKYSSIEEWRAAGKERNKEQPQITVIIGIVILTVLLVWYFLK